MTANLIIRVQSRLGVDFHMKFHMETAATCSRTSCSALLLDRKDML